MELPTGLSFRRCIENSIGYFDSCNGKERQPVTLESKTLVGPFSDATSASGANQKNTNALNIFRADQAILPDDCENLIIEFYLTLLPYWKKPFRCESQEVRTKLAEYISAYMDIDPLETIAWGYTETILNLSWAWRNLESFTEGRRCAIGFAGSTQTFLVPDSETLSELAPASLSALKAINSKQAIDELHTHIRMSLTGEKISSPIKVTGILPANPGCEVFPSQEFIDEPTKKSNQNLDKSKSLAFNWTTDGKRQAIFHRAKISNALQCIDRWYNNDFSAPPINVNPLGFQQQENKPYRSWQSGRDVYHLLMNIEQITEDLISTKTASPDSHFLIANFIRGGLFTAKKKKTEKDK